LLVNLKICMLLLSVVTIYGISDIRKLEFHYQYLQKYVAPFALIAAHKRTHAHRFNNHFQGNSGLASYHLHPQR